VSGVSPAAGKKTVGLIEKETLKKRISNNEWRTTKRLQPSKFCGLLFPGSAVFRSHLQRDWLFTRATGNCNFFFFLLLFFRVFVINFFFLIV